MGSAQPGMQMPETLKAMDETSAAGQRKIRLSRPLGPRDHDNVSEGDLGSQMLPFDPKESLLLSRAYLQ